MPRSQGLPKTGGRKKGTPNKTTQDLKELLETMNLNIPEQICQLLPQLPVEKRTDVLLNLLSYIYPKRRAIEHQIEVEANRKIEPALSREERQQKLAQFNRISAKSVGDPTVAAAFEMVAQHYDTCDASRYD